MKSLMLLMRQVLQECGTRCGTSTDLDFKQIEKRVEHEGLSFLTTSLPDFCSVFEKALSNRQTSFDEWTGWTTRGNLPVFLGGLLDHVFDRESGRLREDAFMNSFIASLDFPISSDELDMIRQDYADLYKDECEEVTINAIAGIRQVTRLFSKIELECSEERIDSAYEAFLTCEKELESYEQGTIDWERSLDDCLDSPFYKLGESRSGRIARIGRLLYGDVYMQMCTALLEGHPIPKHGPGSTADKLLGNEKFHQTEWPVRLDRSFPAGEYLLPSWRYK